MLGIDLRVGSPALDNTRPIRGAMLNLPDTFSSYQLPVDDDPEAIRAAFWQVEVNGLNGRIKFTKAGPAGQESGQSIPNVYLIRIEAGKVILAAGTFGSTEILLRSRGGLPLSSRLGHQFSGNGDLFAVAYGVAMMVNIAWPRQAVYDPAGTSWVLQYLALLFVAALVVVGAAVYRALRGAPRSAETT